MSLFIDKIFQEDCLLGMKKLLPDSIVDVVVTSPPYNIGVDYNSYNDRKEDSEYISWISSVTKQIKRVLKPNGSFFLNIGNRPKDQWKALGVARAIKRYFKLQNTIYWIKSIAVPEENVNIGHYKPINSRIFLNDAQEYIFHFTKDGQVGIDRLSLGVPYKDKSNIGRYADKDLRCRGNVWYIPYETVTNGKFHPAAFPVKLPEMCIRLHGVDKTKLILDPFMGIGSTALAANRLKLNYVGFEIDEEYAREAERLLKVEKSRLFK